MRISAMRRASSTFAALDLLPPNSFDHGRSPAASATTANVTAVNPAMLHRRMDIALVLQCLAATRSLRSGARRLPRAPLRRLRVAAKRCVLRVHAGHVAGDLL